MWSHENVVEDNYREPCVVFTQNHFLSENINTNLFSSKNSDENLLSILVQLLKLSMTGDTAKILVSNSAEAVHFHLKTQLTQTSYTRGVH